MKIPKSVTIAGVKYQVRLTRHISTDEHACLGKLGINECVIHLATHDATEQPLSPDKMFQVFLHEVIHAIDENYIGDKLSERETDQLSVGLYQFLKDNKL